MGSIFAVVAGRRAKFLVALVWLAIVGVSLETNLFGKFSDAENNESTSFLPGDAESTKALSVTKRLEGGELAPIVVYRRDGGLTARDRRLIASDRRRSTASTCARRRRSAGRCSRPTATRRSSWHRSRRTAMGTR